jgi:hypothetical protein
MSVVLSVVLARKQTQPRVVLSVARLLASCRVALITALTVGRFHSFAQDSALAFGGGRHSRFPQAVLGLLAPRLVAARCCRLLPCLPLTRSSLRVLARPRQVRCWQRLRHYCCCG